MPTTNNTNRQLSNYSTNNIPKIENSDDLHPETMIKTTWHSRAVSVLTTGKTSLSKYDMTEKVKTLPRIVTETFSDTGQFSATLTKTKICERRIDVNIDTTTKIDANIDITTSRTIGSSKAKRLKSDIKTCILKSEKFLLDGSGNEKQSLIPTYKKLQVPIENLKTIILAFENPQNQITKKHAAKYKNMIKKTNILLKKAESVWEKLDGLVLSRFETSTKKSGFFDINANQPNSPILQTDGTRNY